MLVAFAPPASLFTRMLSLYSNGHQRKSSVAREELALGDRNAHSPRPSGFFRPCLFIRSRSQEWGLQQEGDFRPLRDELVERVPIENP